MDVLIDLRTPAKPNLCGRCRCEGDASRGTEAIATTFKGEVLAGRYPQALDKIDVHILDLDAGTDADPIIDTVSNAGCCIVASD